MTSYIFTSIFKEFKLIKDPIIFYTLSGLSSLFLIFLLLIASLIMESFIFLLIINFLLFQYNVPVIINTLQADTSLHYSYSKSVEYKYLIFIFVKNNPLIVIAGLFNLLMVIFSLNDMQLLLSVVLTVLIQLNVIFSKLIQNSFIKVVQVLVITLSILINLSITNEIINMFLILMLLFISFLIIKSKKSMIYYLIINKNHTYKKMKNSSFNYKNMYFKLFISYLRHFSIKSYITIILLSLLYIIGTKKFSIDIDIASILIFLYIFDLELIADQQFRELEKTSAHFYIAYLSPLSKLKKFFLTEHFHKMVIYSTLILWMTFFSVGTTQIIGNLMAILIMFFIGLIYNISTESVVNNRKKFNNILFQYIIIVIVLSFLTIKNFVF